MRKKGWKILSYKKKYTGNGARKVKEKKLRGATRHKNRTAVVASPLEYTTACVGLTHPPPFPKNNKTGNVRITYYWGALTKPLLLWKSNKYCILRVRACACPWGILGALACACSLTQHAKRMPRPYYIICSSYGSTKFLNILENGTIFEKGIENKTSISVFSTAFTRNNPHSKKNPARYRHKYEKSSC